MCKVFSFQRNQALQATDLRILGNTKKGYVLFYFEFVVSCFDFTDTCMTMRNVTMGEYDSRIVRLVK